MNQRAEEAVLSASPEVPAPPEEAKNPLLAALGERVRNLRARRGLTRKAVALAADVSERHLANLEYGIGNASILVLQQVADRAPVLAGRTGRRRHDHFARMAPDPRTARGPRARPTCGARASRSANCSARRPAIRRGSRRIALIGLRGAGKSTLGQMLADDLDVPFIELSREIEKFAGCSMREIHDLYGTNAYRRYERRALEETIQIYREVVIATPGGIVSDPATFNQLLAHCTTVWLQADARRAHGPGGRPGRHAADGGQQGSHGRPAAHPGRPRRVLFEGGSQRRHQRRRPSRRQLRSVARPRCARRIGTLADCVWTRRK